MNASEIQNTLAKYAASDLRLVKKHGHISVTDCKDGCIDLEYSEGTYTMIARKGITLKPLLTKGTASEAKAVLIAQYTVEEN